MAVRIFILTWIISLSGFAAEHISISNEVLNDYDQVIPKVNALSRSLSATLMMSKACKKDMLAFRNGLQSQLISNLGDLSAVTSARFAKARQEFGEKAAAFNKTCEDFSDTKPELVFDALMAYLHATAEVTEVARKFNSVLQSALEKRGEKHETLSFPLGSVDPGVYYRNKKPLTVEFELYNAKRVEIEKILSDDPPRIKASASAPVK